MGFNLLGATAGLLEAGGNLANQYAERQSEREKQQLLMQIEERKEKAKMAREEANERFKMKLQEIQDARAEMKEDRKDSRDLTRWERQLELQNIRDSRRSSGGGGGGSDKPSAFAEKLAKIDEAEEKQILTPEEADRARKKLYGAEDGEVKKSGVSEAAAMRYADKYDELVGAGISSDQDLNRVNRYAEAAGLPKYIKKEIPAEKVSWGRDKPARVEYILDDSEEKSLLQSDNPQKVTNVSEDKRPPLKEAGMSILKANQKKAEPAKEDKKTGEPLIGSTDIGTVLGGIVRGTVDLTKFTAQGLADLERDIRGSYKESTGPQAALIDKALRKIHEIMTTKEKLDPQEGVEEWTTYGKK